MYFQASYDNKRAVIVKALKKTYRVKLQEGLAKDTEKDFLHVAGSLCVLEEERSVKRARKAADLFGECL